MSTAIACMLIRNLLSGSLDIVMKSIDQHIVVH